MAVVGKIAVQGFVAVVIVQPLSRGLPTFYGFQHFPVVSTVLLVQMACHIVKIIGKIIILHLETNGGIVLA